MSPKSLLPTSPSCSSSSPKNCWQAIIFREVHSTLLAHPHFQSNRRTWCTINVCKTDSLVAHITIKGSSNQSHLGMSRHMSETVGTSERKRRGLGDHAPNERLVQCQGVRQVHSKWWDWMLCWDAVFPVPTTHHHRNPPSHLQLGTRWQGASLDWQSVRPICHHWRDIHIPALLFFFGWFELGF